MLSVKDVVSTHLAILASTGAGKSYTAGVLIEELMMPTTAPPVLIVDPHGEYDTLQEIHKHPAFAAADYKPEVKIFTPDKIKVRISTLDRSRHRLPAARNDREDADVSQPGVQAP